MTPQEAQDTLAGLGYRKGCHLNYWTSKDACSDFESTIITTQDRVKWLQTIRDIVGRRCEKNKAGASMVSDFDIAMSTAPERCECWLKMKGLWK